MLNAAEIINYDEFTLPNQIRPINTGSRAKVSHMPKPVREVVVGEDIRECEGGLCPPCGGIYTAKYNDGSEREIFVPSNRGHNLWSEAVFLKPKRKTNQEIEVYQLAINDSNDTVPHTLVERIKVELNKHNAAIIAAADLRYS